MRTSAVRTHAPHFALLAALAFSLAAPLLGCADDGGAVRADTTALDATSGDSAAPADADSAAPADTGDLSDSAAPADTGDLSDSAAPADTNAPTDTASTDSAGADTTSAPLSDFTTPGPYAVGCRSASVTYTPPGDTGPRTLRVVTWYPTRDTTGAEVLYGGLLSAPNVLGDAAPAADLGPRPLVVFSHGNGGFAEQSFFFTEFLATHGFVVAALDHTGNTFADMGGDIPVSIFHWRPEDVSAVIDHLEGLPVGDPLAPLISDRIAVAGHSFGGYTTLAVGGATWAVDLLLAYCSTNELPAGGCDALTSQQQLYRDGFLDARVDALVPMSPGGVIVLTGGIADITVPTLLFTASRDDTTPNATEGNPAWNGLAGNPANRRVDFANGGHYTFSDACSLPLGIGIDDGCGGTFLDAELAHTAINAYALAFLRQHLLGDGAGAALLDGTTEVEPDATLTLGQ